MSTLISGNIAQQRTNGLKWGEQGISPHAKAQALDTNTKSSIDFNLEPVTEKRDKPAPAINPEKKQSAPKTDYADKLARQDMIQKIVDHRLGIDRERLDEIEEEMAAIAKDPNLSVEEKTQMIAALEEEKQGIIEKQIKQLLQQEKEKAQQPPQQQTAQETKSASQAAHAQPTQQQTESFLDALVTDQYREKARNQKQNNA